MPIAALACRPASPKALDEQVAGAVRDLGVLEEPGRRRDVHRHLRDPPNAVEGPEPGAQGADRLQRGLRRRRLSLAHTDLRAEGAR
jgi:hypothetical protein